MGPKACAACSALSCRPWDDPGADREKAAPAADPDPGSAALRRAARRMLSILLCRGFRNMVPEGGPRWGGAPFCPLRPTVPPPMSPAQLLEPAITPPGAEPGSGVCECKSVGSKAGICGALPLANHVWHPVRASLVRLPYGTNLPAPSTSTWSGHHPPATGLAALFPRPSRCAPRGASLQIRRAPGPALPLRPCGCRRPAGAGPLVCESPGMVRDAQPRRLKMPAIGFVTRDGHGFKGQLRTLSIRTDIEIIPNSRKTSEVQPDFRVVAAGGCRGGMAAARRNVRQGLCVAEPGCPRVRAPPPLCQSRPCRGPG